MKNTIYTLSLAVALFSLASCNLDLYPYDSIILDEKEPLIQTDQDLETYSWGNYAYFRSCYGGGMHIVDDLMCDGFNATQNFGNNYGSLHRADQTFTSGEQDVESFWGNYYLSIRNFNLLIAEVDKVKNPDYLEDVRYIAAEARFFRAYAYLELARKFGKYYDPATAATDLCVPIVKVYDQNARPARNTVQEVYDFIKEDIDSAYAVLGEIPGSKGSQEVNAHILDALLANYYLDIRDYASAYEKAVGIIDSGVYSLCSTEAEFKAKWFEDGGENGDPEAIMKLPVSTSELPNGYSIYTSYGADANSPTGYSYKALYLPSKTLIDSYNAADWRYRSWFDNCKVVPYAYNGIYFNEKFFVFVKYKGNPALSASGDPDGHVAPVPYSLSEMYLIAAEAAVQGGSTAINALKLLMKLQNARKATVSATADIEAVRTEWFKETVGDGKRITCLKRWGLGCPSREGQAGALAQQVLMEGAAYDQRNLQASDYHFVWPIPSYEMKVNSNLKQNPGYSVSEEE